MRAKLRLHVVLGSHSSSPRDAGGLPAYFPCRRAACTTETNSPRPAWRQQVSLAKTIAISRTGRLAFKNSREPDAPRVRVHLSISILPILTTSKSEPLRRCNDFRSFTSQRG